MLRWALFFVVLALAALAAGYGHVLGPSTDIAFILCAIFVVLFVVSLIMHLVRGRGPTV